MLFNNSVPDREGTLKFSEVPPKRMETPVYKSHAGEILMALIYVLAIVLLPLAPVAVVIGLPVMVVKKKQKNKGAKGPFYRYS